MTRTQERKKALALGLTHYMTGLPCSRGHVARRFTQSGKCARCHDENERDRRARRAPVRAPAKPKRVRVRFTEEERSDRLRAQKRRWDRANPDARRAVHHRRRARKKAAEGTYTADELAMLYRRQRGRCANCKRSLKGGYDADHILPLKLGGSNWITNIQLLCPPCNKRKQAMHPIKWAQREGRLV